MHVHPAHPGGGRLLGLPDWSLVTSARLLTRAVQTVASIGTRVAGLVCLGCANTHGGARKSGSYWAEVVGEKG